MTTVHTLEQLDTFLRATEQAPSDDARRNAWASLKIEHGMFGGFPEQLATMDPFSPAYAAKVNEFMRFLHGGEYSTEKEGFKVDLTHMLKIGSPHSTRSPSTVGSYLISYGFVIRAMNLPVPSRILEIGCGTGALSIHLARMGYDLTAVDVNANFTDHVAKLCEGSPGKVTTITADMNELALGPDFDAVLFYESFHHSYDHPRTMRKAIEFLKPDGLLVLAAEPVVPARCDILPYEWGPRLDGETMRAIRMLGWMELGFTEGYLFESLRRNGLVFRRISSLETHWADLIVANRAPKLAAGGVYEFASGGIGTKMLGTGWSNPEAWGTWSRGPVAQVFLDLGDPSLSRGAALTFDAMPFLPPSLREQRVVVRAGERTLAEWRFTQAEMAGGWKASQREVRIAPGSLDSRGQVALDFAIASPRSPEEEGLSADSRKLGIALARVRVTA